MYQYVIYENPRDYPGLFVLRQWSIDPGCLTFGPVVAVANSLLEIRRHVPPDLTRIPRFPQDDPVIVEVWL